MNGSDAQVSMWNILPQDVVESILRKLSVRDSWACRGVSSCWASAVRSAIEFECVVHVQPRQLRSKLQALQQASRRCPQQGQPVLDRSYTLQLSQPICVVSCAELLTSLMTKSMSFPSCTVKIPLRPPELKAVSRSLVFQNIDEIAYAVSQLRANGVSIYISMQAADSIDLPAPDVMKSMASVIHEVDYAQPASMTSTSWQPEAYESFSEDHLRALKSAHKQMQVLCISDALTAHQFRREYISLVASFRQLKKLVLQTKSASPDLSSLTQLTCLEDVSLMVSGHGDCAELIHNQRHKLVHIRLSATSWAKATYQALSKVTALQTLAVNVYCLTTSSADVIASLQRPHSIHVVLRKGSDPQRRTLQILSSAGSKVTDLTLRQCSPTVLGGLGTMPHLAFRSTIDSTMLPFQPGIIHLTLLDCDQTDNSFIARMLTALPALKSLSFECQELSSMLYWPPMSAQDLIAITQARQLSFLGLKAVRDLSCNSMSMLESLFRAQQELCVVSPRIHVILPANLVSSSGRQDFYIDYSDYPVFCDWRSTEHKPSVAQQFMARVGSPVQSWVQQKIPVCKQFMTQDPSGCVVATGILAIHTFCMTPFS
ncbi:TPA: hypothetical protein ACH3X1_014481 [Trebouxia sp. C0004]